MLFTKSDIFTLHTGKRKRREGRGEDDKSVSKIKKRRFRGVVNGNVKEKKEKKEKSLLWLLKRRGEVVAVLEEDNSKRIGLLDQELLRQQLMDATRRI